MSTKRQKLNQSELKTKLGAFRFYLFFAAVVVVAVYIGFHWGNAFYDSQQASMATHQQSIGNLKNENDELTKTLNIMGVELEVLKLSQQQHFTEIQQAIEREETLRTQLGFYQQVMAPELDEQGFVIQGFNVEPALSDNAYRFELVLMQQNKTKNIVKGDVQVTLIGSENGKAKEYPLAEMLTDTDSSSLKFGFKYFQVLEGQLTLPTGFQPEKISAHAKIFQFKRKKGELTKVFDWTITGD